MIIPSYHPVVINLLFYCHHFIITLSSLNHYLTIHQVIVVADQVIGMVDEMIDETINGIVDQVNEMDDGIFHGIIKEMDDGWNDQWESQ